MISIPIPFDGKASDTRLLSQDVATNALDEGLLRGVGGQFLRVILVVDVVSDADEFATIVAAGKENHGDTQDLGRGNMSKVGRVCLENELIHADRDGTNEQRIEFLVIFGARFSQLEEG